MGQEDTKSLIANIKLAHDIVQYFKDSGFELKTAGPGKWKTRCAFHVEKTPSMIINENFQSYKCFGCGVHGDIIAFVMGYENLSFYDALKKLAEDKNIDFELEENDNRIDYDSLLKILRLTANFYVKNFNRLPSDHPAKKEITSRGLKYDNSSVDNIFYGYSPAGNKLYEFLQNKGFTDDLIVQSGVCSKSEKGRIYDFFRSRLMFIITDRYGKPIGFSSRKIYEEDSRGKYVNSGESPIFHKSNVLYNHSMARKNTNKEKRIHIVEGQFDVAAFVDVGIRNVVASSGTSFTREHINECRKMVGLSEGKLIFCFDGDAAGIKAAQSIFMNYPEIHENAYVVMFPDNGDPCDYLQDHGKDKLVDFVSNPMSIIDFMIMNAKEKYNLDDLVDRSNYVDEAARIIKTVSNRTLRENCIKLLSLESMTTIDSIRLAVEQATIITEKTIDDNNRVFVSDEAEEMKKDFEEVKSVINKNNFYSLVAKFIGLGLTRKSWRNSVYRCKSMFPKPFQSFVEELKKYEENEKIVPEMFENSDMAEFLMSKDFSAFYRFMSQEEIRDQFIYMHKRIEDFIKEGKKAKQNRQISEMLEADKEFDLEYFKSVISKETTV